MLLWGPPLGILVPLCDDTLFNTDSHVSALTYLGGRQQHLPSVCVYGHMYLGR